VRNSEIIRGSPPPGDREKIILMIDIEKLRVKFNVWLKIKIEKS